MALRNPTTGIAVCCARAASGHVAAIGHQPALCREISKRVDRRKTVTRRQLYDRTTIGHGDGMRCNEQAAIRPSGTRGDGALDVYAVVDGGSGHLDPERWCGRLSRMQERDIVLGFLMEQHRHAGQIGCRLLEQAGRRWRQRRRSSMCDYSLQKVKSRPAKPRSTLTRRSSWRPTWR